MQNKLTVEFLTAVMRGEVKLDPKPVVGGIVSEIDIDGITFTQGGKVEFYKKLPSGKYITVAHFPNDITLDPGESLTILMSEHGITFKMKIELQE